MSATDYPDGVTVVLDPARWYAIVAALDIRAAMLREAGRDKEAGRVAALADRINEQLARPLDVVLAPYVGATGGPLTARMHATEMP